MKLPALFVLLTAFAHAEPIISPQALVQAVKDAGPRSVIELAPGTFQLAEPLVLPAGITLKGAGIGKSIVTHASDWKARTETLPDPKLKHDKFDRSGYLIHLAAKAADITIRDLTLTGPQVHGAVFGFHNDAAHLHDLHIERFMYSGIRTYSMKRMKVHDCVFQDTGSRWEKGQAGIKGGIVGGGIFCIWTTDSEIFNNRFLNTRSQPHEHYYGIKGRQGKRMNIHHNTIEVNFSIEFPFENDEDIEIHHNVLHGTVSIPKHAGGPVPSSGRTFHIHHNVFKDSYSIEFVRNGVEIDHNLFDFDSANDHGNLISGFGKAAATGPASFHHNLVSNPGRGVFWCNEVFNHLDIHHNHIITRTTKTPRQDGLFGFNAQTDFSTLRISDNLIECIGQPRSLLRNDASATALIENNTLTNLSDTARYTNTPANRTPGLETPLQFTCGLNDETRVDGWKISTVR